MQNCWECAPQQPIVVTWGVTCHLSTLVFKEAMPCPNTTFWLPMTGHHGANAELDSLTLHGVPDTGSALLEALEAISPQSSHSLGSPDRCCTHPAAPAHPQADDRRAKTPRTSLEGDRVPRWSAVNGVSRAAGANGSGPLRGRVLVSPVTGCTGAKILD